MKINIQNIENELVEFDDRLELSFQEADFSHYYSGVFAVHVVVDKFGKDLRIDIDLKTKAHYLCDRCLAGFDQNFEAEHRQLYHVGSGQFNEEDDIIVLPQNTTEIDIEPVLREMVLLNHPIKLLCREDCKGLCPGCGADLNTESCKCGQKAVDPRWEDLRKLIR